jgi:predicted P-loop ATPase/GTPase
MFRNPFFDYSIFNNKSLIHNGEIMENKKKISAAISAVMNYIKTEEEAICIQSLAAPTVDSAQAAYAAAMAPVKLWGISGRQGQMQMRNMMQMRTFK